MLQACKGRSVQLLSARAASPAETLQNLCGLPHHASGDHSGGYQLYLRSTM